MSYELTGQELHKPAVLPPIEEVLNDPQRAANLWWLEDQTRHFSLLEQIEQHSSISSTINDVIDRIPEPTMTVESALSEDILTESQVVGFYNSLSMLLGDEESERLALYLPFEYLPGEDFCEDSSSVGQSACRFREAYLIAWYNLLYVQDVRANFVDGDVLEEEHRAGDPPRVVKAAHLIPGLIERGFLNKSDIHRILLETDNELLTQSVIEGLIAHINPSSGSATRASQENEEFISDRRRAWLEQKRKEELIAAAARPITEAAINGTVTEEVISEVLYGEKSNGIARQILVEGLYKAVETLSLTGDNTELVANKLRYVLRLLWQEKTDTGLEEQLITSARKAHRLGVISAAGINKLGVEVNDLAGPWSENLPRLSGVVDKLKDFTKLVEEHPELKELVYPVVLVGGSRLKGYGDQESDVDIAIFVKPNVELSLGEKIRKLVQAQLTDESARYEIAEFWLDQHENGELFVRDIDTQDRHIADSYSTHMLFGSAWVGDETTVKGLINNLLLPYFYSGDENKRRLSLERIEQDALQYRLMHKGYARHFPLSKRPDWSQADAIDGDSVFWDPGYRQLATKLFVNTVFLPKL